MHSSLVHPQLHHEEFAAWVRRFRLDSISPTSLPSLTRVSLSSCCILPLISSDQFIIFLNDHCNVFHSNYHADGCKTSGKIIYCMYAGPYKGKRKKDAMVWREMSSLRRSVDCVLSSCGSERDVSTGSDTSCAHGLSHVCCFPCKLWKLGIHFEKMETKYRP